MTKFLKMYGSERNHGLYNPLVDVKKLYKFEYMTKSVPNGKRDCIMMAPCCEDHDTRYMLAGFKTVISADIKEMREYTTDLLRYISKVPDGNIIKTFELVYGDVECDEKVYIPEADRGGSSIHFDIIKKTKRVELEGNWIMEMDQ